MNSFNTLHTFVILAFGESEYLEACIQSVMRQTVPGKMLIATSTPNNFIADLAAKYGIELKINNRSGTIGKDWNFGYSCAHTKYLTLVHQDDIYLSEFAEKCIRAAEHDQSRRPLIVFNKSLVYHGEREVNISYKNILRWLFIFPFNFKRCISSPWWKRFILLFSNSISCPGVFYVKENLGNFRFDEQAKYILDWKAWYEMSRGTGSFIYVPDVLHIHREHEDSATSSTNSEILYQEELRLLSDIWNNQSIPKIITALLRIAK